MCIIRRWTVLCFAWLQIGGATAFAQGLTCQPAYQYLERGGYVVGKVQLDTPLSFVKALEAKLQPIQSRLPVQKGKLFRCSDYEAGTDQLSVIFGSGSVHEGELFRLALVLPEAPKPCAPCGSPPTVDLVYHIYTTDAAYYGTRVFEADHTSLTRRLAPPGMLREQGSVLAFPYLGFNHTRNLFVGTRLSYSTNSGLFSSADADFSGSKDSAKASLFLTGSRKFQQTWFNYLNGRLGYKYENLPGSEVRFKSGTGVISVFGASRALGSLGTIVRFGSAVEGGNQQARSVGGVLAQGNAYGALKSYAGATFNLGRQSFAGSYGIQFGSASPLPSWDYTKYVANISYSTRILLAEHKPTAIDVQLGGGYISGNPTLIPPSERFLGGNVQRNFIEGDSWHLPRNPLLRSFPEQDFGQATQNGVLGGTNYYSANLTVAQAVLNRPIVPAELSVDPSFRRKLGGQIALARESAKLSYLAETSAFEQILLQLNSTEPLLDVAQKSLTKIREVLASATPNADASSSLDDLDTGIQNANDAVASAKSNHNTALAKVRFLAVGFPTQGGVDDCNQPDPMQSLFTQILCKGLELRDELGGTKAAEDVESLIQVAQRLGDEKMNVAARYTALKSQVFLAPSISQPLIAKLNDVASLLNEMLQTVQRLQANLNSPLSQLDTLTQDLKEASSGVKGASLESVTSIADWLVVGFGNLTPPLLQTICEDVDAVEEAVHNSQLANALNKLREQTDDFVKLQRELHNEVKSLQRPGVEVRAIRDTEFTGRLLDVIFRELNLYTISPFAMLDVARLGGTNPSAFMKTRYAAGGGMRFSLVNFNVDIGYGINVNRQPREPVGAFFFSMSISDLFH